MHNTMQNSTATTTADRNLLTEKELLFVKDMLSWELLAMKKCNDAAQSVNCETVQQKLMSTGEKHKQRYEEMLTQLH